jgi:hypothetical protein
LNVIEEGGGNLLARVVKEKNGSDESGIRSHARPAISLLMNKDIIVHILQSNHPWSKHQCESQKP